MIDLNKIQNPDLRTALQDKIKVLEALEAEGYELHRVLVESWVDGDWSTDWGHKHYEIDEARIEMGWKIALSASSFRVKGEVDGHKEQRETRLVIEHILWDEDEDVDDDNWEVIAHFKAGKQVKQEDVEGEG